MQKFFLLLAIVLCCHLEAEIKSSPDFSSAFTEIEDRATIPILTAAMQHREKKKIRLKNGLEVLIVSDPSLEQSGALLSVLAGSWYDPKNSPGLAHFLEHMLFLGTKKYPEEGGFQRFVALNSGTNNAFTTGSHTSYFFSIDHGAFLDALDRFAEFFKEPLLNPSGIERELQAIDQEYQKSLEDDDRREFYVLKELMNQADYRSHSSAGNASTLRHISTESMRAFFEEFYSAAKMRLIVYSSLPLNELTSAVIKDFSDIPVRNASAPFLKKQPNLIGEEFGGRLVFIEPIKELRRLSLTWEVPARFASMREEKPGEIATFLLGDEGENSLLQFLKQEGLAQELTAGMFEMDKNTAIFSIEIDLTNKGLKERDLVLQYVFEAITSLKQQPFTKQLFDQLQRIDTLQYQYQKADNVFSTLAQEGHGIIKEDLESYPQKSAIITKFDPESIKDFLDVLTPQSAIIIVTAPSSLTQATYNKKEKDMGVPYAVKDLPASLLRQLQQVQPNPSFKIPLVNTFVPENLELIKNSAKWPFAGPIPIPQLLQNSPKIQLYWAPDTSFQLPRISWHIVFLVPLAGLVTEKTAAFTDLWLLALKEKLNSYAYAAKVAGLEYSLEPAAFGFRLTIEGYNDKAHILLKAILEKIENFELNEQDFNLYKERLLRDYKSSLKNSPLLQARDFLRALMYRYYLLDIEKERALKSINFEQIAEFKNNLFKNYFVRALLYGNTSKEQAESVAEAVTAIKGDAYAQGLNLHQQIIVLPEDKGPFYLEKKITAQGNALLLAVEIPQISSQQLASLKVLMQAIDAPFFEQLRTVQQTGYIVGSSLRVVEGTAMANFAIQSSSFSPKELLSRIELFIKNYLEHLESQNVTESDFTILKASLIQQLKVSLQTPEAMSVLLYEYAFSYEGDFNRLQNEIEALEKLEYKTFIQMSRMLLSEENRRRFASATTELGLSNLNYQNVSSIFAMRKNSTYVNFSGEK